MAETHWKQSRRTKGNKQRKAESNASRTRRNKRRDGERDGERDVGGERELDHSRWDEDASGRVRASGRSNSAQAKHAQTKWAENLKGM